MVQDAEEGHGETIQKDWTGKSVAECTTTARDRKRWRELMCRSAVSDLQR